MSLRTDPPHFGHFSIGGSENFWMISNRWPQASHSYSYMGISVSSSFEQIAAVIAEHKATMEPEWRGALVEQGVVEGTQRECLPLLLFVVLPEFQEHQLADAVDEVGRIERAPFGLATRAALLHERFLPEEPDALLDGHILCVQPDADDEAREPNE